jgi:hypothetical protein
MTTSNGRLHKTGGLMMLRRLTGLGLVIFAAFYLNNSVGRENEGMEIRSTVEVKGKVIDYLVSEMIDHFESGEMQSYDATVIDVVEPPEYRGMQLIVYHNEPKKKESPWRNVGGMVYITIGLEDLRTSAITFSENLMIRKASTVE